jgi:hypothetical protein
MDRSFVCSWRRRQTQLEKSSYRSLPFCADLLIIKSIIWFLNNSNLHAIISALLKINLHGPRGHPPIYFSVLEEIYNNVVPHWWSAALISRNHSITRLVSFTKNVLQIGVHFHLNMDPGQIPLLYVAGKFLSSRHATVPLRKRSSTVLQITK